MMEAALRTLGRAGRAITRAGAPARAAALALTFAANLAGPPLASADARGSAPRAPDATATALAPPERAVPLHEWEVGPGTRGVLVEDHRVPLVAVQIIFPAGRWMPWYRENHAAEAFSIQLHDEGGEIRRRADRLAARISLRPGDRASELALSCLKEALPDALQLVRDLLENRDFDRRELRRWKRTRKIEWSASLKDPQFVLRQAGARLLFREDDPRRIPYEKPEPILTETERLARVRDQLVRLPGRVVGLAGDLTLEEAERIAADLLPPAADSVPPGLEAALHPLLEQGDRPREIVLTLPRLTQTYFAYGRESLSFEDADYAASLVASHVLGGHFNSRLMVALRQEAGETYGAGVFDGGGYDPGPYALGTFTRTENAHRTEQKLRGVLATFHAEGITEEEREAAAGKLVGSRAFSRQSPAQILTERLWEIRLDLPRGFRDRLAEEAAAIPLEQVNACIRRFHDPALFTMIRLRVRE